MEKQQLLTTVSRLCRLLNPLSKWDQKHVILFIVVCSAVVLVLHVKLPDLPPRDYFLFADQKIALKSHVYYIEECVARILLTLAASLAITKEEWLDMKKAIKAFAIFECFILVDYLLTYQKDYIKNFDSNTIKLVVYAVVALGIVFRDKRKKFYAEAP